jgi:phosphoribosyl 1,2-cyclic phosphate phosphodiesterase
VKARILGAGTSSGVPRIGNDWGACDPAEPRNYRSRAALLVEHEGTRILVDTGPDMRTQLLAADVGAVDAVIWTHDHADHTAGIDDLRQVYHALGRPVRGYARQATFDVLLARYGYVFAGAHGYPPTVTLKVLPDRLTVGPITIDTVDQPHADIFSAGLRFTCGAAAIGYATDFSEMTADMLALYEDLDIWIVDALRRRPHPSHPELARVLGWIERLRPGRAALVHMDQSMDYRSLLAELPAGVEPGYDGMELTA